MDDFGFGCGGAGVVAGAVCAARVIVRAVGRYCAKALAGGLVLAACGFVGQNVVLCLWEKTNPWWRLGLAVAWVSVVVVHCVWLIWVIWRGNDA